MESVINNQRTFTNQRDEILSLRGRVRGDVRTSKGQCEVGRNSE